jgi:gamma-glutamyltranspeptidase/glutathione hydrolase
MHPNTIHVQTELERRVYADRAEYLGDPDFYKVPTQELLSDAYLKERFGSINEYEKTSSESLRAGYVEQVESVETTHYSVADRWGNALSVTTTLNGNYGSRICVPNRGFLLNNEMDDFSISPGTPNQFGLIGGEANAVAPGKRMLSSMTPTIVEKEGKLFMLLGTPGGSTIITSVFQVLMNVMEHGMELQEAVDQPRLHHQWQPDVIYTENKGMPPYARKQLEAMGHQFKNKESIGHLDAIIVLPNGWYQGASDRLRGEDISLGIDLQD